MHLRAWMGYIKDTKSVLLIEFDKYILIRLSGLCSMAVLALFDRPFHKNRALVYFKVLARFTEGFHHLKSLRNADP